MSRSLLAILLVVTFNICAYAQTTYSWVTGERDTLPEWVFERGGEGRYVGISDPCLDSLTAENQALLRAWYLAVMSDGFEISIMQEQFERVQEVATTDSSSDRFTQFMRFIPTCQAKRFMRGRSHTSIFGERFVEFIEVGDFSVEVEDNTIYQFEIDPSCSIEGEYVMNGYERSVVHFKLLTSLNIEGLYNGESHKTEYTRNGTRQNYQLVNINDGAPSPNRERGRYWYINSGSQAEQHELMQNSFILTDGVWSAFLESMVYSIANGLHYAYQVKQVTESSDGRIYNLVRSAYKGEATITLDGFRISNDALESVWRLSPKE